jgi:hypothetical protein
VNRPGAIGGVVGAIVAHGCLSKPAPPAPNTMFVTSLDVTLGSGIAAADAICNSLAHEADLPLDDTFVAWFSAQGSDAVDRLTGSRGWVRTDGKPFVDTVDDLVAGAILYPARLDENGSDLGPDQQVATGTQPAGTDDDGNDCGDALNVNQLLAYGYTGAGVGDWTEAGTGPCAAMHLYCFGVGRNVPVDPPKRAGPLVFLSTGLFAQATGGVATADQLCTTEALENGESAMFLSVLATDTISAVSRFGAPSTPWVRPDGVPVTNDFTTFTAPLDATFGSGYVGALVATGATSGLATGSASGGFDCGDWLKTGLMVYVGDTSRSGSDAFDSGMFDTCDNTHRVYCAEVP